MKKVILKIEGMSCSACQNRVEKYLNKQEGVKASVNLVMQQALIEYDDEKISLIDLDRFIDESGYKSLGVYNDKEEEKIDNTKYYLIILAFIVIFLMYISMSHMLGLPVIPFLSMQKYPINYGITLFLLATPFLIFGFDIIKSGITIHKGANMDTLVTIGVLASFVYSFINLILVINGNIAQIEHLYFESSAMIIYFIKLGHYIDKNSKNKTKEAIKELVQITPESALIKTNDGDKEITIDEVKKGDILICKPGMKIAVDGVIVKGNTHLDETFITGESIPAKKKVSDKVIAGSINIDGYIEYEALKIGPDTTISEIVRLVKEATNTKMPIGRIADTISGYFVPAIIIIALLTFVIYLLLGKGIDDSLISFVTVLVVACPCALGLATPLAIVTSVGKCAKEGIIIKTSAILENANKIDIIVFDKTGTLTYGNLRISKIYNYSSHSEKELLCIASSLEKNSIHPISSAFKDYFNDKIEVSNFKNISGMGLYGQINQKEIYIGNSKLLEKLKIENKYKVDEENLMNDGNSIIYVVENKKIIALIGVMDILRDNAKKVISNLKAMNKDIIMLSGDNEKTAKIIAKKVGIYNVVANVLPQEKEKKIKELISNNHKVMMVGDGINDAPSLVSADIGVSVKSGTDVAGDSADVILINNDLSKIIALLNISHKTIKIIKENLFWAFIYNVLMIPIAVGLFKSLGITISPTIASISMTISSLCVVFNSLRLR